MKRLLSAILTLALLASLFTAVPVSAETTFSSNMGEWTGLRGTWDFTVGTSSAGANNYASPTKTTVAKTDNWTWNADVSTTAASPGFQFQFGRATAAFSGVSYFYVQTTADSKVRLYYYDGTTAANYTGWIAFPENVTGAAFNIKISLINLRCYVYINENMLINYDLSATTYNGGYFGLFNSKLDAQYNNLNLYVNNQALSITQGFIYPYQNGFKTANSARKWTEAVIGNASVGKYATIETDYKYISGNNQSYIRFGMQDGSTSYYDFRIQPNSKTTDDTEDLEFAVYNGSTRLSAWVSGPSGIDYKNFNIKIDLTPDKGTVYINDTKLYDFAISYNGGKVGLATLYTEAVFANISIDTSVKKPAFSVGTGSTANADGSVTTNDATTWVTTGVEADTSSDREVSLDVDYLSGGYQFWLEFGATSGNGTDGYSVRIQKTDNIPKIIVMDNAAGSRVSANWTAFPDNVDSNSFKLTLKYINNIARVYLDGQQILITSVLSPVGSATTFRVRKTGAAISNLTVSTPKNILGDLNMDDKVTSTDLTRMAQQMLSMATVIDLKAADCTGDGNVDLLDLVRLKKLFAGVAATDADYVSVTDNVGYSAAGDFVLGKTASDFTTEQPYVYLNSVSHRDIGNDILFENTMGVYVTGDYTVLDSGIIMAMGNQTLNISNLVHGSDALVIEDVALGLTGDFNEYNLYVKGIEKNTSKTARAYAKLQDSNGNTVYVYSADACFFRADRAVIITTTTAQETALSINNGGYQSAVSISSETFTVYSPIEGASYAHHAHLAFYNNKLYSIFSLGKANEEDIGQKMMLSVSENNGQNWSAPITLADVTTENGTNSVVIPGGLYSVDNMLVAYYASYDYVTVDTDSSGNPVRPPAETTKKTNWKMYAKYTTDGVNWFDSEMVSSAACNFAPKQTASGRLIRVGANVVPYTDDITGLTGWKDAKIDIADAIDEGAGIITEGDFYQTDDGVLRMFFRTYANVLYYSESYDDGVTWTRPYATSFTAEDSKFDVGRLNDGRYYWVGNAGIGDKRENLTVSLSNDGINFNEHYLLHTGTYDAPQFEGLYKYGVYGYPSVTIYNGYMYIIYSEYKETIKVTKIALADL